MWLHKAGNFVSCWKNAHVNKNFPCANVEPTSYTSARHFMWQTKPASLSSSSAGAIWIIWHGFFRQPCVFDAAVAAEQVSKIMRCLCYWYLRSDILAQHVQFFLAYFHRYVRYVSRDTQVYSTVGHPQKPRTNKNCEKDTFFQRDQTFRSCQISDLARWVFPHQLLWWKKM